jgi:hypothetical protein
MINRDKKNNMSGKLKRIEFRVSDHEFSAINSLCDKAKIPRSAYILQSVLNKRVLTQIDGQAVFQLRKIGNNLNQMTRQIHIISKFSEDKEQHFPAILKELSSIHEQIEAISHHIFSKSHVSKD